MNSELTNWNWKWTKSCCFYYIHWYFGDIICCIKIYRLLQKIERLRELNRKYKQVINHLKKESCDLRIQLHQTNKVVPRASSIFTEGQIRKIMWTWSDISNAICLHSADPSAQQSFVWKRISSTICLGLAKME